MSAAVIPKIIKNKQKHIFFVFLFPVDIVEKESLVTVMKSSFSTTAGNMYNTHTYQPRSSSSRVTSFKGFELFVYIYAAASRINTSSASTSTVSVNSPSGAKLLMCFVWYYLNTNYKGYN